MNTFTATQPGDQIGPGVAAPGDIAHWPLTGQTVYLQSGAHLASGPASTSTALGGRRDSSVPAALIVLKVSGHRRPVGLPTAPSTPSISHPARATSSTLGHLVGWSEGVRSTRRGGGWKQTLLGGEGSSARSPARAASTSRPEHHRLRQLADPAAADAVELEAVPRGCYPSVQPADRRPPAVAEAAVAAHGPGLGRPPRVQGGAGEGRGRAAAMEDRVHVSGGRASPRPWPAWPSVTSS